MTMKAFTTYIRLGALSAFLAFASSAKACVSEAPTHNHYLFSVFNRSLMQDRFTKATDRFWQQYTGNDDATYSWSRDEIMEKARQRNDAELLTYCRALNEYIDTNIDYDSWHYPSKEQLARRPAVLRNLLQASKAYKGKRLRSQYALMRMRALFGLKRYAEAITYWQTSAKRLSQSCYRDIMLNIYAGCLWRTGKKSQAVDIYASQEDYVSLKYCARGYRNLAGIQKVYAANPNSPALNYLVQDFVNNVQETMDVFSKDTFSTDGSNDEKEQQAVDWLKFIDAKKITTAEADRFVAFARTVVGEGKTKVPSLWQAAIGCIEHQTCRYAEAKKDLAKALAMDGTQRMKDNARAIYAANSVFTEPSTTDYSRWLTGELQWLERLSAQDRESVTLYETDHYRDVEERMVYNGLVPEYMASGNMNAALVLLSFMNETDPLTNAINYRLANSGNSSDFTYNSDYSNIYFETLEAQTVSVIAGYAQYLKAQPADPLEGYAWQRAYRDSSYYNDIIGTRLLAQGSFGDAVPYLEKVSTDFLNTQNIKPYAYSCDYGKERWMGKQKTMLSENTVGNGGSGTLTANKKLQYCRDMLALQQQYSLMREGEERNRMAYRLATLWYQGSYEGDCWWLTQYGISVAQDSAKAGNPDFVAKAISLLDESVQSTDFRLKEKSLYALAFIRHGEPWYLTGWDDATQQFHDLSNLRTQPQSRQYKALSTLSTFYKANASRADSFVTKCDVLKRFMKTL